MEIYCVGYYSGGDKVGEQTKDSGVGWQVMALSANVEVPESPFPLKIARGNAIHTFKCDGYKDMIKLSSWEKK